MSFFYNKRTDLKVNVDFIVDALFRPGYDSVNGTCTDIDECSNLTLSKCNVSSNRVFCRNNQGGYQCICIAGFTGNGTVGLV